MALIDGVKVNLRGREFVVPPLRLDVFERLWVKIDGMDSASPPEAMAAMREVIHAALVDNYPEMTVDDLRPLLDVGNVKRTFQAVLAKTSEGKPEGEPAAP